MGNCSVNSLGPGRGGDGRRGGGEGRGWEGEGDWRGGEGEEEGGEGRRGEGLGGGGAGGRGKGREGKGGAAGRPHSSPFNVQPELLAFYLDCIYVGLQHMIPFKH